jgi:hypothetical protein
MKIDWTRQIDRRRLYEALGYPGRADKLPADFAGEFTIPVSAKGYYRDGDPEYWGEVVVVVKPSARFRTVNRWTGKEGWSKVSEHRTFVKCGCGKLVPTGRYHQHFPACPAAGRCVQYDRPQTEVIPPTIAATLNRRGDRIYRCDDPACPAHGT